MMSFKQMGIRNKIIFGVLCISLLSGTPLLATTIYDSETIGVDNTDLPTEGTKTFGPENNKESSLRKLAEALEETKKSIGNQICDHSPTDELCATIPNDNTDFSELFVYLFITPSAQNSFDVFSWQSFVGLNWPAGEKGLPVEARIGDAPELARIWTTYKTPRDIFSNQNNGICSDMAGFDYSQPYLKTETFLQTGGKPLIDKNLNFVVYDIRINDVLADYIEQNNLTTKAGQQEFMNSDREIDYPVGYYQDPVARSGGKPGSLAIKTAWKIIDIESGDDPSRYYSINGLIPVSAENSATGKAFCVSERLGLIGMHIMSRTDSGSGRNWTWSTFEHVDNAPLAANARRPTDILQKTLFDGGCRSPGKVDQQYALFDKSCPDCVTNHIEADHWQWSEQKPYAKTAAFERKFGTQVVRCWEVFEGTQVINGIWRDKLKQTVWGNYQLLSAQWKGGNRGMMFPQGEVPRFLINPTLETYDQYSPTSSCLSCHATARSLTGQDAKFSFLLDMPKRFMQLQ